MFGKFFDAHRVIPIDQILPVVVPFFEKAAHPLVPQLLDIIRVHLQPAAENVLELVTILELESLPVYQVFDDRRALIILGDELDQLVNDALEPMGRLVPDEAVANQVEVHFHALTRRQAGLADQR